MYSTELSRFTLLLREVGSGSRRVFESALEEAGLKLKSFKKVMELDSTEAVKSAVEVGLGIGFASRWALGNELELGLLNVAQLEGIRVTRRFTFISRIGPQPQGLVDAFRAFTLQRAAHISRSARRAIRPLRQCGTIKWTIGGWREHRQRLRGDNV